jgi:hypothetical protein
MTPKEKREANAAMAKKEWTKATTDLSNKMAKETNAIPLLEQMVGKNEEMLAPKALKEWKAQIICLKRALKDLNQEMIRTSSLPSTAFLGNDKMKKVITTKQTIMDGYMVAKQAVCKAVK